jgi:hypothetical protein
MSKATLMFVLVMACVLLASVMAWVPKLRSYGFSDGN